MPGLGAISISDEILFTPSRKWGCWGARDGRVGLTPPGSWLCFPGPARASCLGSRPGPCLCAAPAFLHLT